MTSAALLDLHRLTEPNGAVRAGAADRWSYAWPRDSAFAAVALARAGHREDALRILRFLSRLSFDRQVGFEARYHLSGVGTPDDREAQSDGAGWALWALGAVEMQPGPVGLDPELRELLDRCTDLVLRLTDDGAVLPPPSPDYWEVPVGATSLGTAAPLLAGLRSSARVYAALGEPLASMRAGAAATRLEARVRAGFAPDFERFGSRGGLDAAVTMLMPPFSPETPAVVAAWEAYQRQARRPAGGLAPGVAWKRDGVSWSPETALVALTAAASGRDHTAERWLDWLDAHRTTWGSLPEKVTATGRPAGPAPLAWTAALVVLTVEELDAQD
jgi:GH15 family glucan-1,4-alpha-glucosidase